MNPGPGEILVSLDPEASAPAGSVRVAGLPPAPFAGWLGLLSALQMATNLLAGARGDGEGPASSGSDSWAERAGELV